MLLLKIFALGMAFRSAYELGDFWGNVNGMKKQQKIFRKLLKP